MSHGKNKFVKAVNQDSEPNVTPFSKGMKELFGKGHRYDAAGLTPEERLKERQSLAVKEIVIKIRSCWIGNWQMPQNSEASSIRRCLTAELFLG